MLLFLFRDGLRWQGVKGSVQGGIHWYAYMIQIFHHWSIIPSTGKLSRYCLFSVVMIQIRRSIFLLSCLWNISEGFVSVPSSQHHGVVKVPSPSETVALQMVLVDKNERNTIERLEQGLTEMHRRDRRDFFNQEKWVKHRDKDRFVKNLIRIPFSRVVWMIAAEVSIISGIAWLLVAYNHLFVLGFVAPDGVQYPPITDLSFPLLTLPTDPFVLSSPALSLLLGTSITINFFEFIFE